MLAIYEIQWHSKTHVFDRRTNVTLFTVILNRNVFDIDKDIYDIENKH